MDKTSRRDFVKTAGLGLAAATWPNQKRPEQSRTTDSNIGFELGMASYTFRNFGLEETLSMTKRLGLRRISFKSFHLPLESSESEIRSVSAIVKESGLQLYGCGVVYMRNEEEVHEAFNYAAVAGMKIIIGVPNHELLDLVNRKVGEFDIQVAIHNHGPGDQLYPTPESAYSRIRDFDHRFGLCIDVGHTQRSGIDPSESASKFRDRLLDVHIKDVSAATRAGSTVEIGRGVINIPKFLETLIDLEYTGTVAFEHEKDPDDPLPGVAESVGYVRGILAAKGN